MGQRVCRWTDPAAGSLRDVHLGGTLISQYPQEHAPGLRGRIALRRVHGDRPPAGTAGLEIPENANVIASCPIARVKDSKEPDAGKALVSLVLSPEGQRILENRGLISVAPIQPR